MLDSSDDDDEDEDEDEEDESELDSGYISAGQFSGIPSTQASSHHQQ